MDYISTLMSKCNENSAILDIGANTGGYANMFMERPFKTMHLFEPCPKLVDGMIERFKGDKRIKIFKCGVTDKEFSDSGYTVFQAWTIDKPESAKRGLSLGALEMVGNDLFSIDFITIDDHVKREGMDNVDFIKIDVDGYEFRVLRGAEKTIQKFRPGILIEISYMVDDIGDSVKDFLDFIYDKLQYRLYTCDGEERTKDWMLSNYPWHTSYDMMMIPSEVDLKDIKK